MTSTKIFKFQVEKEVKFKGLKDWLQWWIQQLAGPGGAQELSEAEKKGGEWQEYEDGDWRVRFLEAKIKWSSDYWQ